ncbi:MAG: type II secretion system secretin GspD [Pseudomonadales bacterium]|nr:type II secretion system secretin GspD [Pseudomonadales bacterium]
MLSSKTKSQFQFSTQVSRGLIFFVLILISLSRICMAEDQTWKVNLKDADIRAFITQISDITGRSFVVDPRVKGKVTVISTTNLSEEEVFELFQSVLNVHGYAAVPSGSVLKVVPNTGAKQDTIRFAKDSDSRGEELITQVIAVKNTPAVELVPILRPMVPQYGHLAGVASANALIISDHAENIKRIIQIIERLDGAESEEIEVIQLKEAWVGDVVDLLERLTPVATGKGKSKNKAARVRVVAEERTNRLIVKGEKSARARIRELVRKLDQPSKHTGTTKVIYLRHGDAVKVAEVLKGLMASSKKKRKGGGKKEAVQEEVNIQADETLNALVIRGEPADLQEIQDVVRQLDVRRAQVLIEAAIVEVSGDISKALGVQWGVHDKNLGQPLVGVNFEGSGSLNNVLGALSAGTGAALANGITIAGGERNSAGTKGYGVLVQALANASNANLLSTPSIMTLDNEEAEIVVGQNVPFITGTSTSGSSTTNNPFQTISREDVGLTLKVVPQINDGDVIRLQVEQEVSAVVPTSESVQSADLITSKRSIKTTILVDNANTVVLGGLIQDDFTDSESKVPLLGDIPLIGRLFKSTQRKRVKRNLLVFLTPTIIRDANSLQSVTERKYKHLRELQIGVDALGKLSLFKEEKPELPKEIESLYHGKLGLSGDEARRTKKEMKRAKKQAKKAAKEEKKKKQK